jgi:hypothetical protein
MVGVNTFLEALNRRSDTRQLTLTTKTLEGGEIHEFSSDISDNKVESINFRPSDVDVASEGVLFVVRPLVLSGSTSSNFTFFEDESRDPIEEVLRIDDIGVNDNTQTFQPGSGTGVQFEIQTGEKEWYFTLDERSGNDVKFKFRMRWLDVGELGA